MTPLLLSFLIFAAVEPTKATAEAPSSPVSESLYQLPGSFEDSQRESRVLAVWRGEPVLLAMVYASCPRACPLLISDVKRIMAQLTPGERANVRLLLVSLDPEHDTPGLMAGVIADRGLDAARTVFMRSDKTTTRTLASALGVRYRPGADGAIDHTSKIVLLNRAGVMVHHQEGLGLPADALLESLRAVIASPRVKD